MKIPTQHRAFAWSFSRFHLLLAALAVLLAGCSGSGDSGGGGGAGNTTEDRPWFAAYSGIMEVELAWKATDPVDVIYSTDPDCDWGNYSICDNGAMLTDVSDGLTLGAVEDGLDPDQALFFVIEHAGRRSEVRSARPAPPAMSDLPNRSSDVFDMVVAGDRLIVGGEFNGVRLTTGGFGLVDRATGRAVGPLPVVDGRVEAIVPDGQGGWFIGGEFNAVQHEARQNLARIRPNGTLDPDWSLATDGPVYGLLVLDGVLYIGGAFSDVGGNARQNLAAWSLGEEHVTDWAPAMSRDSSSYTAVHAFASHGDVLFAGGLFSEVNSLPRDGLAAFDTQTGDLTTQAFDVTGGGEFDSVETLTVDGDVLYVGGSFSEVEGEIRQDLAAYDTGDGSLLDWAPEASDTVYAIEVADDDVYLGGDFAEINGTSRAYLAAVDRLTGDLQDWEPGALSSSVSALAVTDESVYAGGRMSSVDGVNRRHLAEFSRDDGWITSWNPGASGSVRTLVLTGDRILLGGAFDAVGGEDRDNLAAFDKATGQLDELDLRTDNYILTMHLEGDTLYLGGTFTEVDGDPRGRLAALDLQSDALTGWAPETNGRVSVIEVDSGIAYVGGGFDQVGEGEARSGLAAFSTSTGDASPWSPDLVDGTISAGVSELAVNGDYLYVGGRFTEVDGSTRNNLAAFHSGLLDGWDPNANSYVSAMLYHETQDENHVLVGGYFSQIDGQDRSGAASVHPDLGQVSASSWNAQFGGTPIRDMTVGNGRLYAAGSFEEVGGLTLGGVVAFDQDFFTLLTDWDIGGVGGDSVKSVVAQDGRVYMGGSFSHVGGTPRPRLGVVDAQTGELLW